MSLRILYDESKLKADEPKLIDTIFTPDVKQALKKCKISRKRVNAFIEELILNFRSEQKELAVWKRKLKRLRR